MVTRLSLKGPIKKQTKGNFFVRYDLKVDLVSAIFGEFRFSAQKQNPELANGWGLVNSWARIRL